MCVCVCVETGYSHTEKLKFREHLIIISVIFLVHYSKNIHHFADVSSIAIKFIMLSMV